MCTEAASEDEQMGRALLTDGERDAIRGEGDASPETRSTQLSRVRRKIEQMEEDAQLLREHRSEMYEDLRDAVLGEDIEKRFERLENEVEELREQVEDDE
jgi:phage shock protein A